MISQAQFRSESSHDSHQVVRLTLLLPLTCPNSPPPELTNDLHRFDSEWHEILPTAGRAPLARSGHGFAAVGTSLYVFGGVAGGKLSPVVAAVAAALSPCLIVSWHWQAY